MKNITLPQPATEASPRSGSRWSAVFFATVALLIVAFSSQSVAQTQFFWRNDGGLNGNWNSSTRWWTSSAVPAGFGQLRFNNTAYLSGTNFDALDTWRIFIESTSTLARTNVGAGAISLYDFTENLDTQVPLIRNDSAALNIFSMPFRVGITNGATRFNRRVEIIASGGDLQFGTDSTSGTWTTVALGSGFTRSLRLDASSGRTITMNGGITEANAANGLLLQKIGSGTAVLNAANSYSLGTVMDAGTLRAGDNAAFGTGLVEFYGGTIASSSSTARSFGNALLIGANVALGETSAGTGALTFGGPVDLSGGTRTVTFNVDTTFSARVTNGSLTKAGNGQLTLSSDSTSFSTLTINAGNVALNGNTLITGLAGSAGALSISNGKVLTLSNSTAQTFGLEISGAGGLTKAGSSTLTLDGNNTYTGTTTLTGGGIQVTGTMASTNYVIGGGTTLATTGDNLLSSSADFSLNGGTLRFNTNGQTISGAVALGTATTSTISVSVNASQGVLIDGLVTGSGNLVKEGTGRLILSNANSYTGTTVANFGTLQIDGNQSSAIGNVTIGANATLTGSGTIGGATTISGVHSPGNSPGVQSFGSSLTYNPNSSLEWELFGNTSDPLLRGAAGGYDGVNVAGNLSFAEPFTLNLVFNAATSAVNWSDSFWNDNRLGANGWLVYQVDGITTGSGTISIASDFEDLNSVTLSSIRSGASFGLTQLENDIYLTYTVPEPSTYALLGLGAAGLAAHLVRRRRRS